MVILFCMLMPTFLLLMADALGVIDLSTKPLTRVVKWLSVAVWAWFMPLLVQVFLKFEISTQYLNLWKLFILGVLLTGLIVALMKWIWRNYGPVTEGHRRCPSCRKPVLKVMLECPLCQHSFSKK